MVVRWSTKIQTSVVYRAIERIPNRRGLYLKSDRERTDARCRRTKSVFPATEAPERRRIYSESKKEPQFVIFYFYEKKK